MRAENLPKGSNQIERPTCQFTSEARFIGTSSCGTGRWFANQPVNLTKTQPDKWKGLIGRLLQKAKLVSAKGRLCRRWQILSHSGLNLGPKHPLLPKRGSTTTALAFERFKGTNL